MKQIQKVWLRTQPGICRTHIPIGWESLVVYLEDSELAMDVLVDPQLPASPVAICVVDVRFSDEVPQYCGEHLGSVLCLHVFEVNQLSVEARG